MKHDDSMFCQESRAEFYTGLSQAVFRLQNGKVASLVCPSPEADWSGNYLGRYKMNSSLAKSSATLV